MLGLHQGCINYMGMPILPGRESMVERLTKMEEPNLDLSTNNNFGASSSPIHYSERHRSFVGSATKKGEL